MATHHAQSTRCLTAPCRKLRLQLAPEVSLQLGRPRIPQDRGLLYVQEVGPDGYPHHPAVDRWYSGTGPVVRGLCPAEQGQVPHLPPVQRGRVTPLQRTAVHRVPPCCRHGRLTPMTWGRGSTRASRDLRDLVLREEPICGCPGCAECTPAGCGRPSTDDDHLVPLSQGGSDDRSNHGGKCHPCHELKSKAERLAGIRNRIGAKRPPERHPGLR